MLPIASLNFGFIDAENYKRREYKDYFQKIFLRDRYADEILHSNRYFIIGEKGTGKTAYAVYLNNFGFENTKASIKYVRETDYRSFLALKASQHLKISGYEDVWSVILLLLMCEFAVESRSVSLFDFPKLTAIKKAIDDYYSYAFSPEIITAMQFVEGSEVAVALLSKYVTASGKDERTVQSTEHRFQINLRYIERKLQDALRSLKLSSNLVLLVDGIDIRPSDVTFADYIDCLKGLANAAWSLNADFFSNIKDSKGRLKVVLLLRPDVFDSLGFQNQNAKVRDNAVVLDWRTTYADYRGSRLFRLIDNILGRQQSVALREGEAWDAYFGYRLVSIGNPDGDASFVGFLRHSLYRPRDVLSYLTIMQRYAIDQNADPKRFTERQYRACRKEYSNYLLGEIKDQVRFFYSDDE